MKLSVEISAPSPLWRGLKRARAIARETFAACVAETGFESVAGCEVSLRLTDDAEVRELNARWRGINKPTNVLSFSPGPAARGLEAQTIGDIALAYETLASEAEESGTSLADHCRHLVAHGFLHLIGYDHRADEEAERMEELERRILARLGVADPYANRAVDR